MDRGAAALPKPMSDVLPHGIGAGRMEGKTIGVAGSKCLLARRIPKAENPDQQGRT